MGGRSRGGHLSVLRPLAQRVRSPQAPPEAKPAAGEKGGPGVPPGSINLYMPLALSGSQSIFKCPPRHVSARLAICPCRGGQGSSAPSKAAKAAVDWYENGGAVTLTHTHDIR